MLNLEGLKTIKGTEGCKYTREGEVPSEPQKALLLCQLSKTYNDHDQSISDGYKCYLTTSLDRVIFEHWDEYPDIPNMRALKSECVSIEEFLERFKVHCKLVQDSGHPFWTYYITKGVLIDVANVLPALEPTIELYQYAISS